jgi:hypothetical protein
VRIKELHAKYEKYFSPLALLAGFIWDNLTLQRIDLWLENLIMISYLLLALVCIVVINAYEAGRIKFAFIEKMIGIFPYILQFTFGGLFSAFVIFYTRSSSIIASWPFLLVLAALLVGNELFREQYRRLAFQMSIYFLAVFSYSVFAVPVLLGRIGPDVFVISGYASLALITSACLFLRLVIPERFKHSFKKLALSIAGIYTVFNILYFANIIPPIPLAIKDTGIYHDVARAPGGYTVKYEPSSWYEFWRDHNKTFHWQKGEPVYCFSSIFAPADISAKILHRWESYDENTGEWLERDILDFSIIGGRDGGFRGYTYKYGVEPGKWRVDVITERGQLLGRNRFTIVESNEIPILEEKIY